MKYFYDVQGSQMPTVPQIEINVDTVYFRSNIVKISETTSEETGEVTSIIWQYDEIQMTYSEYLDFLQTNQTDIQTQVNDLFAAIERGLNNGQSTIA